VKRVVFGSYFAYGETPTLPKVETMSRTDFSLRRDEVRGELMGQTPLADVTAWSTSSMRYFNILVRVQDPGSPYSGVWQNSAQAFIKKNRTTVFGDGQQTREVTFVATRGQSPICWLLKPKSVARSSTLVRGDELSE